jgi:hypothetical protein
VPTVMTKVFLLNLLGSEILCEISQEPHKSMTLKCGCVTSQRFFVVPASWHYVKNSLW